MSDYEILRSAQEEISSILSYTFDNYGPTQMMRYSSSLKSCLENIAAPSGTFKKLNRGKRIIRILHCQKHYIFALERDNRAVLVLALFHEKMDLIGRLENRLKSV